MAKNSRSKTSEPKRQKAGKLKSPKTIEVDISKLPIVGDPSLRVVWSDFMRVYLRGDAPVIMLNFYSVLPDRLVEAARVQTSVSHLQRMLEVLCSAVDYYPVKPS